MRVAIARVSFVFAVALAVTIGSARVATNVAHADDAATINEMKKLARQAMENYDLMEYEEAKKMFNKAILIAKKQRMGDHPLTAQLYLHLGIVYFSGFQDVESAFSAQKPATVPQISRLLPASGERLSRQPASVAASWSRLACRSRLRSRRARHCRGRRLPA